MLIDDITIKVKAGDGGDGLVAFNKNKMQLGPSGGSGGDGGSVYVLGVSDIGALTRLRNAKEFDAGNGTHGRQQLNDGPDGNDLIIDVPVGTVVHNLTIGKDQEVISVGEKIIVARGGWGGKGNFHFRGPENTSPREFERGRPGQEFKLRLELKLIADIGLIGLPNAGKSSLINELTRAQSRVANYPFTTLEPHLGSYYGLIIADIPGLIEGASVGKGLGVKFLRHVERTKTIFHLISAESERPVADYKTIRKELGAYNKSLLKKKEHILLTKHDTIPPEEAKKKLAKLRKFDRTAIAISIHDWDSIEKVQKILNKIRK